MVLTATRMRCVLAKATDFDTSAAESALTTAAGRALVRLGFPTPPCRIPRKFVLGCFIAVAAAKPASPGKCSLFTRSSLALLEECSPDSPEH